MIEFIDTKIKEYYLQNIDNILDSNIYIYMDKNNYKLITPIHDLQIFVPKNIE